MDKFRREISTEILVGLFMFVVLIALGVFTIVLSRDNIFKKSYPYEFVFSEISGLREGDNVYLRGMNIGRVKQTTLEDSRVRVYVTLDHPIQLRKGYQVEVIDSSLLGGKYLKIYEGDEDADVLGNNVTVIGEKPIDVVEELSAAVKGIQEMIDQVNEGQGTLGKLLNDDTIYNNMVSVSEQLKNMSAGIERGEGTIGKLLKDEEIYDDAHTLMANLREISDRLVSGEGSLAKLISTDAGLYEDLEASLGAIRDISERINNGEGTLGRLVSTDAGLYADLEASMGAIREISERINNGEGTLGKLVGDAQLYEEATLLIEDMRAAIDDLREASPITSFSSVVFGAF